LTTTLRIGLVVAIAVVVAWPLVARVLRRRFDPFEPIVLFAIAYGVMFVVRPAFMIASDRLVYEGPRTSTDVSAGFSHMLALALVGAVAFVLGYELGLARRLANRRRSLGDLDTHRTVVAASMIGALGVASFVVFLASSGPSALSLILRGRSSELTSQVEGRSFYLWFSFFLLVPSSVAFLALGLERRRKLPLGIACALAAIFLLRTVPLGARIAILPLLGGVFVLYYLRKSSRPSPLALVGVALLALVASSFLSDLRGRGTRHESVGQTIVRSTRPARVFAPFRSSPDTEMAPVLAAAVQVIPKKLPYTYGRTILDDLVTRPIPRALWSDKPRPAREKLISFLWPVERRSGGINPEFSVLLYFFWDFGVAGVMVGMLLFGFATRFLFEYFCKHRYSLSVQVLYSLTLWFVVIGLRNNPVDTLVQFMFMVFPLWLALRVSTQGRVSIAPAASR
jgi:O-antigen polysaccharide polymerase Wzy-like protein